MGAGNLPSTEWGGAKSLMGSLRRPRPHQNHHRRIQKRAGIASDPGRCRADLLGGIEQRGKNRKKPAFPQKKKKKHRERNRERLKKNVGKVEGRPALGWVGTGCHFKKQKRTLCWGRERYLGGFNGVGKRIGNPRRGKGGREME